MQTCASAELHVSPFIERSLDGNFIVGLRTEDGCDPTVSLVVDATMLAGAVLRETPLTIFMDSEGRMRPEPQEDDDIVEAMQADKLIEDTTIDALADQTLRLDRNEPNEGEDGVLPAYQILRASLVRALARVDEEISGRLAKGSSIHSGPIRR
jgi:hypothetical protein